MEMSIVNMENSENSENETNEDVEEFDIDIEEFDRDLPAAHSYLPGGLTCIRGRSILEAGWEGKVPCWCHHSIVFPGESVPMHCPDLAHYRLGIQFIQSGRLFGLIFPEGELFMSDYGVLCEVTEATEPFEDENEPRRQISFKAQARQRFRLINTKSWRPLLQRNMFISSCDIKILPDVVINEPLQDYRIFSASRQNCNYGLSQKLRKADALVTQWPQFVYDIFNVDRIVNCIKTYFKELSIENLPEDLLALSFWVASNLTISMEERLKLFIVDNASLRLYWELKYLYKVILCCSQCSSNICKMEEIFAMSNEGIHTNYCNVGGYVHNIVTVKSTMNIDLQGRPSLEFTWFPGYYWTIAVCSRCFSHIGWKFTAEKKSLRPQSFWGLTRNAVTPKNLT
ncbi:protein cereblon-like isoform X2 [Arctopsyche grandis]|uniref:protein cereblon-like isoform X2 n=1 Tax=Arctopsyche grandis TaxID=121162 RepID=UPI00406D8E05